MFSYRPLVHGPLLAVLVLFAVAPAAAAQSVVWHEDAPGSLRVEQVVALDESAWSVGRAGFAARPPAVHWARLDLPPGEQILDFKGGWHAAEVWTLDPEGVAVSVGRIDEHASAAERTPGATMAVRLDPPLPTTVLVRLETGWNGPRAPEWLSLEVVPEREERRRLRTFYALNGAYTGIVFAVVLYTLFLYLATRFKAYLLYVLYAGSFGLTWISQSGFGYDFLWPWSPTFQDQSLFVLPALSAFFGVAFARTFLDIGRRSPRWDRALELCQAGVVVSLVLHAVGLRLLSESLLGALALLIVALVVPAVVAGLRAGSRPAKIFVFANGPLLFFVVLYTLGYFGLVEPTFVVIHGPQMASAVEKVLLAFGVANRMNLLKEEKIQADRRRRVSLQNEVKERTRELENAHTELERSNAALVEVNLRLEELSTVDPLTGLANRRQFDTVLQLEWARCQRHGTPLSLLLVDVDHFKQYNDTRGHLEGDDCLARVARTLREQCRRAGDLVARFGGEEFAVVLPGTPAEETDELARRVRDAIETLAVPHDASSVSDVVTVSVGAVTQIPTGEGTALDLIAAADRALYEAKRGGRNRVEVA